MNLLSPQLQSSLKIKSLRVVAGYLEQCHTHTYTQSPCLAFVQWQNRGNETKEQVWAQSPLPSPTHARGLWDPAVAVPSWNNYALQTSPSNLWLISPWIWINLCMGEDAIRYPLSSTRFLFTKKHCNLMTSLCWESFYINLVHLSLLPGWSTDHLVCTLPELKLPG